MLNSHQITSEGQTRLPSFFLSYFWKFKRIFFFFFTQRSKREKLSYLFKTAENRRKFQRKYENFQVKHKKKKILKITTQHQFKIKFML